MHYKTNRQNHDFQIAYFVAGSCQTPDAAYSILCDQEEDRSNAIKSFGAYSKRDQAKVKKAEAKIAQLKMQAHSNNFEKETIEADILEAEADIEELKALAGTTQKNYDAALAELAFIEKCKAAIQPLRKFAHLPDAEAHEAAQHDEWKLQLIHTAENHMLSGHAIPPDHFATMRMHPSFTSEILPSIDRLAKVQAVAQSKGDGSLIAAYLEKKKEESFNLPRLLGAPEQETKTEQVSLGESEVETMEATTSSSPDYSPK